MLRDAKVRVITQLLERDLAVTRGPKKDDNFVGETYKEILSLGRKP